MTTIDRPGRALIWAEEMFGPVALDPNERIMRFMEEAIELAHAMGLDACMIAALVERVYTRDPGDIAREIGQAQMTLELLAKAIGVDAETEATKEFQRVQSVPKIEWERRHAAKAKIGIALLFSHFRE